MEYRRKVDVQMNRNIIIGIKKDEFVLGEQIERMIVSSCIGLTFQFCDSRITRTGHDEMCLFIWTSEKEEPEMIPLSMVEYIKLCV